MAYNISGRILHLEPTQEMTSNNSGKTYKKRDLVIAVRKFNTYTGAPEDDVTNTPKFTFFGFKCEALDAFKEGDLVTVAFDLNGREYTKDGVTNYFNEVRPTNVYPCRAQAAGAPEPAPAKSNNPFGDDDPFASVAKPAVAAELFQPDPNTPAQKLVDDLPF